MKEELKKSLRTYGALLLLGVTGVPLGAAVGLIEALFCRLLLKVTAIRVAHLFWCLPFLAMAGLVIVAVNQKFGGRGKGGMSLIFDVAYEEETELPLCMIPLAMLQHFRRYCHGSYLLRCNPDPERKSKRKKDQRDHVHPGCSVYLKIPSSVMAFNDTEPHKKAPVPQILFCETGALFML